MLQEFLDVQLFSMICIEYCKRFQFLYSFLAEKPFLYYIFSYWFLL